jgi:hypothetical protein
MALHFIGRPAEFRVLGPKSTILAVDNRGCCRRWVKHEAERPVMGNSPQRENVQEKGAARDQTGLALSSFLTALDC